MSIDSTPTNSFATRDSPLALILLIVLCLPLAGHFSSIPSVHAQSGQALYAFVENAGEGTVTTVDLARLEVLSTFHSGPANLEERAFAPTLLVLSSRNQVWGISRRGGYLWILKYRGSTARSGLSGPPRLSSEGGTPKGLSQVRVEGEPVALDFSPAAAGRAFVAVRDPDTILALDSATRKILRRAPLEDSPSLLRLTPDGKLLLVLAREASRLYILDASTLEILARVAVARHPELIAVMPDSAKAFIAASGGTRDAPAAISVVELSAGARQPPASKEASYTAAGALLANLPLSAPATDLVLKPDGGELYAILPAAHGLTIINTWTHEVVEQVTLGAAPVRGALTRDASVLYVTDAEAGRVIPVGIRFRAVGRPIPVGSKPTACRLTPEEDLLLVVNEDSNDLAVIRTKTQSLLTLIPVGSRPRDLVLVVH